MSQNDVKGYVERAIADIARKCGVKQNVVIDGMAAVVDELKDRSDE